eukprot:201386_1
MAGIDVLDTRVIGGLIPLDTEYIYIDCTLQELVVEIRKQIKQFFINSDNLISAQTNYYLIAEFDGGANIEHDYNQNDHLSELQWNIAGDSQLQFKIIPLPTMTSWDYYWNGEITFEQMS